MTERQIEGKDNQANGGIKIQMLASGCEIWKKGKF